MAESRNGTVVTPSAGNWPGSYYANELGRLLPEPFPPPFPPMEAPSLDRLQREYVAGGGWAWYGQVARTLPNAIDDATADFGDDLYERMMFDPQVAAVINIFKASILETGLTLTSCVRSRSHPDYDIAAEITEEAGHMITEFEGNLDDVLFNMLDCVAFGNKVAEQTYKLHSARKDGRRILNLDTLKVRPRRATVFAVDIYMNIIGLLIRVPPNASPWSATMMFGPQDEPFNLLPPQKFVITNFRTKDGDPRGTALDPETPIPTPDGWRRMDDLQPGDKIFDEQGRVRYVTARQDWEDRPCYELTFTGGEKLVADANHRWLTSTGSSRKRRAEPRVHTTEYIARSVRYGVSRNGKGLANHAIDWAAALDYPEQMLPLEPYYFGLWLGDGNSNTADLTCHAQDAEETAALVAAAGYTTHVVPNGVAGGNGRMIRVRGDRLWDSSGPTTKLRMLDVRRNYYGDRLDHKHIPPAYLRGSVDQRRELLAGLMDSDGSVDRDGRCEFTNTNRNLVDGVSELVRSLGVAAHMGLRKQAKGRRLFPDGHWRETSEAWSVFFTPPWSPFKLARKTAKTINSRARTKHYIVDVKPVQNRRTVCIETDGPSHLYLAGRAMIPTHNSLLRPAYGPWWQKQQIIPEYLRYLTQFASPSIYGIVGPNAVPLPDPGNPGGIVSVEQVLLSSLQQFRNGTAGAFPAGTEIHTVQQTGDGSQFLRAFDHWDQQITKAVLTQELATEEGRHMARAAAQVHQDVLDTLIRQGKLAFAKQLRNQIFKRWVAYNWGDKAKHLAPIVGLGKALTRDQPATWTAVAQLFNSGYMAPSQQQEVDDLVGLPVRDETEVLSNGEVVVVENDGPTQPPAGGAPGSGDGGGGDGGNPPTGPTTTTTTKAPAPAALPDGPQRKQTEVRRGLPGQVAVGAHTRRPPAGRRNVAAVAEPQSSGGVANPNLPMASPSAYASLYDPPPPQEVRVSIDHQPMQVNFGFDKPPPMRVKMDPIRVQAETHISSDPMRLETQPVRVEQPSFSREQPEQVVTHVTRDKQGRITGTVATTSSGRTVTEVRRDKKGRITGTVAHNLPVESDEDA